MLRYVFGGIFFILKRGL